MRDMILQIISLALFAITSNLLLRQAHAQSVPADQCAKSVHAIIARGQGAGNDLNVMVKVQNKILEEIPGSTSLGLPYAHDAEDKFIAVRDGALMLQQYVADYHKSCPQAKIALLGYSLGGVTTMEAICGTSSLLLVPVGPLDPSLSDTVIAITLYGEETYVPLQTWNVGDCTIGMGLFPRLDPSTCDPFASSLHSYCDYGDAECCAAYPLDNNAAHHDYIKKYGQDVVDFIKRRLNETT